jgi:lipopolysaccharide biosynthesis glycosyltransferase
MPAELAEQAQKVIYLDSDMICLGDITKLWNTDFADNSIAAASDLDYMLEYAKAKIDFKGEQYFNAGMILINIAKWNENHISQQAMEYFLKGFSYDYLDQDILNTLLCGKTKFVSKKWNTIYTLSCMNYSLSGDERILHLTGPVKPWQAWAPNNAVTNIYRSYWEKSAWADEKAWQPLTYKQAKYMYRKYKRLGEFGNAAKWYFKYASKKIKSKIK